MEAIKIIEQYWQQLKGFAVYAQYCVESELHTPACRSFWMNSIIVAFVIATLLIVFIGKRVIKEQLEFYRNRKRLEARAIVADAATMKEHKRVGDDAAGVDLSHEELTAEIRQAVKSSNPSSRGKA